MKQLIINPEIISTIRSADNTQSLQRSVQYLTTLILDIQSSINEVVIQLNEDSRIPQSKCVKPLENKTSTKVSK